MNWGCTKENFGSNQSSIEESNSTLNEGSTHQRSLNTTTIWENQDLIFSDFISSETRFTRSYSNLYLTDYGDVFLNWRPRFPFAANIAMLDKFYGRLNGLDSWQVWNYENNVNSYVRIYHAPSKDLFYGIKVVENWIYLSVFHPFSGWGQFNLVTDLALDGIFNAHVEPDGNLLICWHELNLVENKIAFVRYHPDVGFSNGNEISLPLPGFVVPQLEVRSDVLGNIYLFWLDYAGFIDFNAEMSWAKFDGVRWSKPQATDVDVSRFSVAIESISGNIEFVLVNESIDSIYQQSFKNNEMGLVSKLGIYENPDRSFSPTIVTNHSGDILMTWISKISNFGDAQSLEVLNAKRFSPYLGWQDTKTISNINEAGKASLAINEFGNALAAWKTTKGVYANYYDHNITWSPPYLLASSTPTRNFSGDVDVAIASNNESAIYWEEVNSGNTLDEVKAYLSTSNSSGAAQPLNPAPLVNFSGMFTSTQWKSPITIFDTQVPLQNWTTQEELMMQVNHSGKTTIVASQFIEKNLNPLLTPQIIVNAGEISLTGGFQQIHIPPPDKIITNTITKLNSSPNVFYLTWDKDRQLSFQLNNELWRKPVLINNSTNEKYAIPLSDDRIVYIWKEGGLNATVFDPLKNEFSEVHRKNVSNTITLLEDAIVLNDNSIVVPLFNRTSNSEIVLIHYVPDLGWKNLISASSLGNTLLIPDFNFIKSNEKYIITARFSDSPNIISKYYDANNEWQPWEIIGTKSTSSQKYIGVLQSVSNTNGEVFTFWVTEEQDAVGNIIQKIHYNQFSENVSATSNWIGENTIASVNGLASRDNIKIHLDDSGNIRLLWLDTIENINKLVYMFYDPITGWSEPEDIIVYDSSINGEIVSYELSGNKNGDVVLAWNQLLIQGQDVKFVTLYSILL